VKQMPRFIKRTDHTSFTVSSLSQALEFWHGALGLEIVRQTDFRGGAYIEAITGIPGAELAVANVAAPGHIIELIEYRAPPTRTKLEPRICDVGSSHIAFEVDDLDGLLAEVAPLGWKPHGSPQPIAGGPRKGYRVVYVRGPDGIVLELIEPAASQ